MLPEQSVVRGGRYGVSMGHQSTVLFSVPENPCQDKDWAGACHNNAFCSGCRIQCNHSPSGGGNHILNGHFRQFKNVRFVLYYNNGKLLNKVKLWYDSKNAVMIVHACIRYAHRAFDVMRISEKHEGLIKKIVRERM